jgi:alanyl-tRNA synthetase
MKNDMQSADIRSSFLEYFKKNGHAILASSSLIPHDDPTIMFNNAGMNQFKNVFLGTEKPKTPRATTSQKCVRAGGKHNDLDNVGFTARHHTFFEMLGNFSFGDYFKEEAIVFAWDYLTKELGLDKSKLHVTAFHTDTEAKKLWLDKMGIKPDHFTTFGEKDNFWRMGDVGPCGPCSEIFYDFGPEMGTSKEDVVGGNGDRFIEIWNLVFMQFFEDEGGQTALPHPSIDTGMGLERISMVMQGKTSNYETDLFMPIIENAASLLKIDYDINDPRKAYEKSALRVLADHSRALSFLIADGVLPSNEGRGYVLRRILRRAVRFNHKLSPGNPVMPKLCKQVIEMMSTHFPELNQRAEVILSNISEEESKFLETLDKGEALLTKEMKKLGEGKTLSGKSAFKLYDTFGFPVDLTKIILTENGFGLDEQGFEQKLDEAKQTAKAGSKKNAISFDLPESVKTSLEDLRETKFTGYDKLEDSSKILELHTSKGKIESINKGDFYLISDSTPFYAESGGQAGDKGLIKTKSAMAEVLDVKKLDHLTIHQCKMHRGEFKVGEEAELVVNGANRKMTEKNHSATHLLHAALIKVCGTGVQQAGSLVDADKLRFDFSHKGPVSKKDLQKVEELVNFEIKKSSSITTDLMNIDDARKAGAQALFGEKYADKVRVLSMGAFSKELCGGTHVSNTGDISAFKIKSETGVSSGVRRIEAVTANGAFDFLNKKAKQFEEVAVHIGLANNATSEDLIKQIQKLNDENKSLRKKLKSGANQTAADSEKIDSKYGEIEVSISHLEDLERDDLRDAADHARDKMQNKGVCVFAGQKTDKGYPVLVSKTKALDTFNAGAFLKELTSKLGGKGGGRPDFAQGTIDEVKNLQETTTSLLRG